MAHQPWAPYEPRAGEWNLKEAGHLLRRATFGFTANQLQQALADGPQKTIDRLLAAPGNYAEFEQGVAALTSRESSSQDAAQLWLYRMIHTPYPFHERATLFWRDYFAVDSPKLERASMMEQYLQELRKKALEPQGVKPEAVVKWLIGTTDFSLSSLGGLDSVQLFSTVLRSNAFFSPAAYRQKVKSPLEFALNLATAVDAQLVPAQLHAQLAALGQRLPNANGSRRWLNTFTIVGRSNLAASMLAKVDQFLDRRALLDTLLQNDAPQEVLARLAQLDGRELVQTIADLPEFQLL